ncbi:carbonic anhydrase [Castellaniella sp.]|uniref:carbonic anhydrase n=1 Tax=Castellaniella sp. TaxID=1955812 RepID=UPI003560450E
MRALLLLWIWVGLATPVLAASWGYEGDAGPSHWGALSPEFGVCDTGRNQSPVDIHNALPASMAPLSLQYDAGPGARITNNGHTIQVDFERGNDLILDGESFALVQMHFHAPAEHTINGRQYPFEAHLVHANDNGDLAVLGVLFEEGAPHLGLMRLWSHMPVDAGVTQPMQIKVLPSSLLPARLDHYRFSGSLTTPPCSEGVRWLVLENPVQASSQQIETFRSVMGQDTNRPIQPLNGRVIVR